MTPKARKEAIELVASLKRHILALEALTGHQAEIDACKKAVDRLKQRLEELPEEISN